MYIQYVGKCLLEYFVLCTYVHSLYTCNKIFHADKSFLDRHIVHIMAIRQNILVHK